MQKRSYKKITIVAVILFISCNFFKDSPWVWDIEGEKITVQDIEDAYEGYLFWWAVQFNTTPEQIKKRLDNLDNVSDPRESEILSQLKKEYFVEGLPSRGQSPMFKKLVLVNLEAEKSGFMDREDIRKKLDFMNRFFIYNLYLMDKIKPGEMEISDEEAITHFDKLRKSDPRYRTITLLKGREMAKQQLLMQRLVTKQNKMFNDILEAYKIKQNPDFKIENLLSKEEDKASPEEDKTKGKESQAGATSNGKSEKKEDASESN